MKKGGIYEVSKSTLSSIHFDTIMKEINALKNTIGTQQMPNAANRVETPIAHQEIYQIAGLTETAAPAASVWKPTDSGGY